MRRPLKNKLLLKSCRIEAEGAVRALAGCVPHLEQIAGLNSLGTDYVESQ